MKKNFPVPRLDRVVAVLDGSPKLENPYNVQNLRLQGYDYWMRYGYTTIQPKQTNFKKVYGLGWSQGVSQISTESSPTPKEEVVTIEGIGDPEVIRPYSRMVLNPVNTTTFAPTQIGTTTLTSGKWGFASYNDYIYAICPGADKLSPPKPTVYKHLIGETVGIGAWSAVQDSSYNDPGLGGQTTILANSPRTRVYTVSDTFTVIGDTFFNEPPIGYTYTLVNGAMRISSTSDDTGNPAAIRTKIDFPTLSPEDTTKNDYIIQRIKVAPALSGNNVVNAIMPYVIDTVADKPEVKFNGITYSPPYKYFQKPDGSEIQIVMFIGNNLIPSADRNKFQSLSITFVASNEEANSSEPIVDYMPIEFGGVYLNSTASSKRIWDSTAINALDGSDAGIKYATRYTNGAAVYGPAITAIASKAQASGYQLSDWGTYYGARLSINGQSTTLAPWTTIEYLRLGTDNKWRVIGTTASNTATPSVTDTYEEYKLLLLPEAPSVTSTGANFAPPFRTAGIVGAFSYKQSMVWLINQTSKNIQLSRVGDPLELFDTAKIYGETDNTVPGQYTLADDQADVPVWGTQAGVSAFIIGKYAAYAMVGDYPRAMSPSRQIPGSRGIVGCYAGTRFRNAEGIWGAAYADTDLNIWVVNSVPAFIEDASAKPQEISLPIRGKLKDFLFTQQKIEISNLDITNTKLVFEEEESSLWVMLGKRAAVFRQDMVGNGWELYDYTMSSDVAIATCTDFYTTGATADEHNNGTSWSNFGFPFASDNSYCTNTFALGAGVNNHRTKYLTADGYLPSPLIPTNATITGVVYRLEDSKTGDLAVTNIHAHPSYNNTSLGSNLSTNRVVTTSDVTQDFAMVSLPTVAQLNSGLMGIDIRYESEEWLLAWLDPANYTVVITPTSPQVRVPADPKPYQTVYTVTVTYTAGGTKPPYAFVNLTGQTTIGGDVVPILGTGDTDNGLGGTNSGQIGTLAAVPPDPPTVYTVSTNTTVRQKVLLSAGVGTYQVTMTSNGTLATNKFQATHTLTGVFDPATLATVRVDNVAMKVCYTVINTETDVQWSQVNFSPNGKYLGFRSSGELDIIEKDFRTGLFIGGTNRDSGLAPSNWFFTTQAIQWDGSKARLASVQYHGQNYTDVVDVAVSVDDSAYVSGTLEGVVTSKWYKFHPSVSSGIRHNVKITGNESDATLKGYTLEFSVQSRGKPR